MKLTVIGGGSVRTPRLIPALVRRAEPLDLHELWLMDTDRAKLRQIGALCQAMAERLNAPFKIMLTSDAREALKGASHIITSIRPGNEAGRILDEKIALSYNVLGQETTGAGGFAMAMRSLPALLDYCKLAEKLAPNAWIYNFTNPSGLVVQGLHDAGFPRVIGLCDSANGALYAASRYLGVPEAHLRHVVFGLNHLSWTRSIRIAADNDQAESEEVLPVLLSDPKFIAATHLAMFDRDLVQSLGMFLNEYLFYYYHRDQALRTLLNAARTRGEDVAQFTADLLTRLHDAPDSAARIEAWSVLMAQRSSSYMVQERQGAPRPLPRPVAGDDEGYAAVALGCMEAIITGVPAFIALNVPNQGAIDGMRADDIVEVTCRVDSTGPHPLPVGAVPEGPYLLMRAVKYYERLASQAILKRSKKLAASALLAHPLIGSYSLARTLVKAYLDAHGDGLGRWA